MDDRVIEHEKMVQNSIQELPSAIFMEAYCLVTFDLVKASSSDYTSAYEALTGIGFSTKIKGSNGKDYILPNTTCVGLFQGSDLSSLRDALMDQIKTKFSALGLSAYIYLQTTASQYSWKAAVTGSADYRIGI